MATNLQSQAISTSKTATTTFKQEWAKCINAVDILCKRLEKLPSEAVNNPLVDAQLNKLTDIVKQVAQLSGEMITTLPSSINERKTNAAETIQRPTQATADFDLIKFDDNENRSDTFSSAFDLPPPLPAASSAVDELTNFLQPSTIPDILLVSAEAEGQRSEIAETEGGGGENLELMATPSDISERRHSSVSIASTNDGENRIVNYAFKDWQFARPRTYTYLSFDANIGERVPIHIGCVESPAIFFVTPDAKKEMYEALEEQLQVLGELLASEKIILKSPSLDQPCIARYAVDGLFYRGIVKTVGNTDCLVQYVDFGNSSFIPINELFPLPVALLEAPCAVIKCSLYNVDTRELTADVVEDFLKRVREGNEGIVEPSQLANPTASPPDQMWRVRLFNTEGFEVTWQKQKHVIVQSQATASVNLPEQRDDATEENARQRETQEVEGAVGNSAQSTPVGDLLGMGGFAPQLTDDEQLKKALELSMVEY